MKISAINNYQFYNVKFEGKKNNYEQKPMHTSNTLKAIPLAVLLAMSPLNMPVVKAQNGTPQIDNTEANEKIVDITDYGFGTKNGDPCQIKLISTDDDDESIEKIQLEFPKFAYKRMNIDGNPINAKQYSCTNLKVNSLKKMIIEYQNSNGSRNQDFELYAEGTANLYTSPWVNEKTNETVSEEGARNIEKTNFYIAISKELFDELNYLTEYNIPCKTVTVNRTR